MGERTEKEWHDKFSLGKRNDHLLGRKEIRIYFRWEILEQVTIFHYLGSLISSDGRIKIGKRKYNTAGKLLKACNRKFIC